MQILAKFALPGVDESRGSSEQLREKVVVLTRHGSWRERWWLWFPSKRSAQNWKQYQRERLTRDGLAVDIRVVVILSFRIPEDCEDLSRYGKSR